MAERASGGQHKRLRCHSAPGLPHESKGCENLLAVILGNSSIGNSLIHCKEPATTSLLFPQALDLGYLCTGPLSSSPLAPGRQLSQNSTLLRTLDIDFGYFYPLMILDDMHSTDSLRWCKLRMVSGHMSLFSPLHEGRPSSTTRENEGKGKRIWDWVPDASSTLGIPISQTNQFPFLP